jgi:hypothetical protein
MIAYLLAAGIAFTLLYRHMTRRPKLPTGWEWRPRGDGAVLIDQTDHDRVRGWVRRHSEWWHTSRGSPPDDHKKPLAYAMRHVERELELLGWKDEGKA